MGEIQNPEGHPPSFMHDFWEAFSRQMRPRYHEISAYLIALTCCWLFIFNAEFRDGVLMLFSGLGSFSPFFMALGLIEAAGLALSLMHAFIKRQKSALERALIGWFLTGVSGVASFFIGIEMIPSRSPMVMFLATWNILMSIVILAQMGMQKYDVDEENASLLEVFVSTGILVAILSISDLYFQLSWALTLSLGIFFATSIYFVTTWLVDHFDLWPAGIVKTRRIKRRKG